MMLLQIKRVTKRFGGLTAVKNIDFEIERREIVGLIGPNGAGKTTLFNVISGFYSPTEGNILFEGVDITGFKAYQTCRLGIARTFQIVKPFGNMNVLENVMVGNFCRIRSTREVKKEALKVLELVGLSGEKNELAKSLTLPDRKRLELAKALATQPKFLLLDEVNAGLNPAEIIQVLDIIRRIRDEWGMTFLVIEHLMSVIMNLSERIVVLSYGEKIAEGTPDEVSKNQSVIEAYLGEEYTE
jgi:branched-chain amino acid transport system ATP-binding protein